MPLPSVQTVLMCAPDFFGIDYVINPWMEGQSARVNRALAQQQWDNLCREISACAEVALQPPQRGLPDLVFTANAGLVLGNKAVVSRFRNPERQGEEPFDLDWFSKAGFDIVDWPQSVPFEGAGDALFDRGKDLLWVGNGFRSDPQAPVLLEQKLGRRTAVLHLVDPRFYHLDTCLCPLEGGYLLYFPEAFDAASRAIIETEIAPEKRLAVTEADALQFCCNAVDLKGRVFMNGASEELQNKLRSIGFFPVITPLTEFLRSGGGAKCLTLKLIEA